MSISSTSVTEEAREEKEAEESSTEPEDRAFTGLRVPILSRPGGVSNNDGSWQV